VSSPISLVVAHGAQGEPDALGELTPAGRKLGLAITPTTSPNVTLSIYAQVVRRDKTSRERLAALLEGRLLGTTDCPLMYLGKTDRPLSTRVRGDV